MYVWDWLSQLRHLVIQLLRVDWVGDPIGGFGHPVVNARLASFCTWVSGRNNADEGPTALDFRHQGPTRVALTGVFAAPVVAGADHLVVDDHVNTLIAMPTLAFAIFNHWNVHNLQWRNDLYAAASVTKHISGAAFPTFFSKCVRLLHQSKRTF